MLLRRQRRLTRDAMMASRPRLNPAVTIATLDTGLLRMVYDKAGGPVLRWARRAFAVPESAEVVLDEIGSAVVRRIDGRETVKGLIAYVADELKLSRKEAEVALLKYLDMLARRSLIGFETPREFGGR